MGNDACDTCMQFRSAQNTPEYVRSSALQDVAEGAIQHKLPWVQKQKGLQAAVLLGDVCCVIADMLKVPRGYPESGDIRAFAG